MEITVNGKKTEVDKDKSLMDFLISKGMNPALVVCELNLEIPPREMWTRITLQDGDKLEIVKFIGGG